jgi:hypothetical protein
MVPETSPAERALTSPCVDDVSNLRLNDRIEATGPDGVRHCGLVEEISPEMKVVWINEEPSGIRRMLDTCDYSIHIVRA